MSSKKVYSFSSVGEDYSERIEYASSVISEFPISIATPMSFSRGNDGTFVMHKDFVNQIKDNFKNMIATNHGERLVYADFGANLKSLLYDLGNEEADRVAVRNISRTTKKYMPFIDLSTFETSRLQVGTPEESVKIRVIYNVPSINLANQAIEIIIPVR